MMCTDCNYRSDHWFRMKIHYMEKHPNIKNPGKYFTKEAKLK